MFQTVSDIEQKMGAALRSQRIAQDLTQSDLANKANVSLTAVKNLENGLGVRLHSYIAVLRALHMDQYTELPEALSMISVLETGKKAIERRRARPKVKVNQ